MNRDTEFRRHMQSIGAVLVRETGHRIYRLPTGQLFVTGKTVSDQRAYKNAMSTLRRLLAAPAHARG